MNNTEIVAMTAAKLMDILDAETNYSESATIAETMVIVRVEDNHGDELVSYTQWRASSPVRSHQLGLLMSALNGLNQNLGR